MKYFSMFSGIGGFEYGLQQSKHEFECIGFSEIDKYASSIYIRQFPNHKNYGDATEIDPKKLPDFDFLVGGFPCQAFSISGNRKGFNDTRGTLFFEIARILKDKKPKYFLLENVRNLLSHEGGGELSRKSLKFSPTWVIMLKQRFIIPRITEHPKEEKEYSLKDIIQKEPVSEKYYLSEKTAEKLWS